ncbi:MAG: DUF3991 and toprim domain-containing protein [Oscillospiraceae bacterium]|nr:DUF3991 and toprim domain-containing protein [Oscillospiraceae bacterium]
MGYITKSQIEQARQVNALDYILAYEPDNIKRVGNEYRLKDHESLAVNSKGFYWHSQGFGAVTALDYLVKVHGVNFAEAVETLCAYSNNPILPQEMANSPPERNLIVLPLRNKNSNRVISYLQSRGIDKQIILDCINRNDLYESLYRHDCIFTGRDEHGKTRYAAIRSTTSAFKRDTDGSDKRFCFIIPPKNTDCQTVIVTESAIDCLSHQNIYLDFDAWRLALSGTALSALTNFLDRHKEITHIIAATDNDEAGHRAAAEIAAKFKIKVTRSVPELKDWNEVLQSIKNQERGDFMKDVRKDIKFIDSGYNTLFTIKDGDSIKITSGYDGEEMLRKCRFIDECHTDVGSNIYHICEFAERMEKAGNKYEPVQKQERKLDILAAKYGENLQAAVIPMTETAISQLVGGKYEVSPFYGTDKSSVFGALVRGKSGIAVCGIEGGTLTSLHPYWAQKYKRELSPAEPPQTPTLHDRIEKAKAEAAAYNAADSNRNKKRGAAELE